MDSSIIILGVPIRIEMDKPLIPDVAAERELALWCDFRVMGQSTYFDSFEPFTHLNISMIIRKLTELNTEECTDIISGRGL